MSRRRSSGYAISLFAFQDIITSVSGVLIMVVLLLALELTNRTFSKAVQSGYQKTASQVRNEKARLAKETEELEVSLRNSTALIRSATESPSGLLEDRIRGEEAAVEILKKELAELESAAADVGIAEQELEGLQSDSVETANRLRQAASRITQLKEAIGGLSSGQSIAYAAPRGIESQNAWICDVSGERLKLHTIGRPIRRHEIAVADRSELKRYEIAMDSLAGWIDSISPGPEYVLFLIRPSGAEVDSVLTDRSTAIGASIGIELIGEEQEIVDESGVPVQ